MDRDGVASDAPRALKVIDTVVGGEERRRDILARALRSAGTTVFPADPNDFLSFVRAHLLPVLTDELGARLASVLLEDIDRATRRDLARRGRTLAADEAPASSRDVRDAPSAPRDDGPASSIRRRYSVLLVDRDRVGASMLARGILTGGCDVTVSTADALNDEIVPDVIILAERDAIDMPPPLRAFFLARPDVPVIVRVQDHQHLATSIVQSIGARRCTTIASTAPTMETVHAVRKLAEAS